ncbi:tetratricopeptide repeat protein [Phaeodactylibacter luteus]|uniref:Tetratricopeptide repeat protein n=1 Tax=Phaeodactylibacter luteus TaxID=1564516 RepID=A0A5C6RHM6_9BACT|nr:tetratricopeptide repeat protein [Phaeodactylibacter luteus]TXB61439.1 tetratricopeptide repeat protein [Phaeodactylibacter luteus]
MTYKAILSGYFDFGTERSYQKVFDMFEHRSENYYRGAILLKSEEVFAPEARAMQVPRLIGQVTGKEWNNTVNMIKFVAQYAIAGGFSAWMVDEGKVVKHHHVEPNSDKAAVQAFLQGRELINEAGREEEAMKALSRAIEKFERHAKAYERRGFVNHQLRNYNDAMYDYSKSIDINPSAAEPYMGRALIYIARESYAEAISDLDRAIKNSIPLMPLFWQARRIKGECHLEQEQWDKAEFELKFVTKRAFTPEDANFKWRKRALFNYGKALYELGKYPEALKALDEAAKIETDRKDVPKSDLQLYRGMAMKKAGKEGFKKAWKEAANSGSKRAAELLQAI